MISEIIKRDNTPEKRYKDKFIVTLTEEERAFMDEYGYMLGELPTLFQETALLDRIHGFVKGWDIPRMNDGLKLTGWALNSEYFCSILHELRNDMSCGKKQLDKDTVGINKKLLGKDIANFYCMDCLADFLGCTVDDLLDKIEEFKDEGCTLFK